MFERLPSWLRNYPDYRILSKTVIEEAPRGSVVGSFSNIILAQLIGLISSLISYAVSSYFSPTSSLTFSVVFIVLLRVSLLAIVVVYFLSALLFLIAKALGGQGTFSSQTYVLSIFFLCNSIFSFIFQILSHVPQLSLVLGIIVSIIGLYAVLAFGITVQYIHKLSALRTILTMCIAAFIFLLTLPLIIGNILGIQGF